jgi:hypothetical protein
MAGGKFKVSRFNPRNFQIDSLFPHQIEALERMVSKKFLLFIKALAG